MGGKLWRHFVPFEEDVWAALESLRAREFAARHYELVDDPDVPASSTEDALRWHGLSGGSGRRSTSIGGRESTLWSIETASPRNSSLPGTRSIDSHCNRRGPMRRFAHRGRAG